MYKVKKLLSLLIMTAVTFSLVLTGCGGDSKTVENQASTKNEQTSTAQNSKKEELPPVKLSWYMFQSSPGNGLEAVENAIGEYLKDKINATIKIYPLAWDEFKTKVSAMSAANEEFDIVFSPGWIGFEDYYKMNVYQDITEMLPKYCPKTMELFNSNTAYKQLFTGCSYDNKIYGIPTIKEVGHAYGAFFNKALLEKYNIDISNVKTALDLEPLMETIKAKEPGIVPIMYGGKTGPDAWLGLYSVLSDDVLNFYARKGDTKVVCLNDTPEFYEFLKMVKRWYEKGFMPKDIPTMDANKRGALVSEGKVFIDTGNCTPGADGSRSNDKVKWVQKAMEAPSLSNKDLGGSQNSISRTSKNPDRALMFLELVNTDKTLNNLLAYGIENTHYTKTGDNVVKPIDNSGYSHGNQWAYGNMLLNYLKDSEDPDKWKKYEEFNKTCVPDPNLGFKFDLEKWTQVVAATKAINDESGYIFYGIGDIDKELEKTRKKLKDVGYYNLLDEVQKAYDEFLKNKK